MGEGDLAKRFRRWIYYEGELAPKNNSEVMGGFNALIEEAKREFPDYFDNPELKEKFYADRQSEYIELIGVWFEKWFGEEEKEDG